MSKLFSFQAKQAFPVGKSVLWDFISKPSNLSEITPPYMGFYITSDFHGEKMYPGQIISYKVSPLMGIKMNWVTEITHVKDGEFFVDEQRFGPYRFWHHQHLLEDLPNGVLMTDTIHYKIPFGVFGDIANSLMVQRKLKEIFNYRKSKLNELFGSV